MNVELEYRYRDFGNFKRYNAVIFGNQSDLLIDDIGRILHRLTRDDGTFIASQFGIPEMFFTEFPYNPNLDWQMHEYCGVSKTELPINDAQKRDIKDLLSQMSAAIEGR